MCDSVVCLYSEHLIMIPICYHKHTHEISPLHCEHQKSSITILQVEEMYAAKYSYLVVQYPVYVCIKENHT